MKNTLLLEVLKERVLICDGAAGTMFYSRGINPEVFCEYLNISDPCHVSRLHREYIAAGADIIETNTFGANAAKLAAFGYEKDARKINLAGAQLAAEAAGGNVFVAGSIGPLSRTAPDGELSESQVYDIYRLQAEALAEGGVDCFILETFSNLEHIRIALSACKKAAQIPVICQMVFSQGLRTGFGNSISSAVDVLSAAGADILGANCGQGPAAMLEAVKRLAQLTDKYISAQPNAGYPQVIEGRTMYFDSAEYFASYALKLAEAGANIVGGCCGTTPEYIRLASGFLKGAAPALREKARPGLQTMKLREKQHGIDKQVKLIVELLPPKGADAEKMIDTALMLKSRGAKLFSLPENPLAQVRMSSIAAAGLVKRQALADTIFHYTCRDRNLIGLQSDLLGACALGLDKVLAVTGDPASLGSNPEASSVFDLNSIKLVGLISNMRRELGLDLSIGVAFNPNFENISGQLERLKRKIEAGADFVLTQPVFDIQKAVFTVEEAGKLGIPVYFGILPLLSKRSAEFLHNEVPGMSVPLRTRQRMDIADKILAAQEGIKIVLELTEALKSKVSGFYLISPAGKYEISAEIIERIK
ncbi:MAG: bifunctional homocysteine S-methyltransferase/methylenetetrahydrofolate reductase [Candidatus Omnitrophota bacterium]